MYEIHITVGAAPQEGTAPQEGAAPPAIEKFCAFCKLIKCKPILIELPEGAIMPSQLMTSSHIDGMLHDAHAECQRIETKFREAGFVPVRRKIEIPMKYGPVNSAAYYFEMHMKFSFLEKDIHVIEKFATDTGGHMSRNSLKKITERQQRMVTWRFYGVGCEEALAKANNLEEQAANAFPWIGAAPHVVACEKEYVVYDSNLECDDGWASATAKSI